MKTIKAWTSHNELETEAVGRALAKELSGDGVLLLEGDLGAGKTVLVRGLARQVGVDPRQVQSPTYALIHEYESIGPPLIHVDLYRLDSEDVESLGLEELLAGPGIKAIEWPQRLPQPLPDAWHIEIRTQEDDSREIRLTTSK